MIVTCPVCSTRYLVDPRSLGNAGRLVRCANCAHTWHQMPPADAPRRIDVPPPGEGTSLRAGDRVAQLPALAPQRRRPWVAIGWILLILVVGGIGAAGYEERDQVVTLWPRAARLYALLGVPVAQPGAGLVPRILSMKREVENDLPTLVIQGEVVNTSQVAQDVPKVRIILRGEGDQELQSWSFSVTDERLLPGASVPFRTSVTQPSEAAKSVVATFAGSGG